jgi:hypothetical protein
LGFKKVIYLLMVQQPQMLLDPAVVEALLAEPEERYMCAYDFLENLQKHIEAGDPRVVEVRCAPYTLPLSIHE